MSHDDAVRERFGTTAGEFAARSHGQIEGLRAKLHELLAPLRGDERALDVGTGAGALALALAPLVGEVVGIDLVPALLAAAREAAPPNATFVEGDGAALPFEDFSFDIVASRRTIHHTDRPEVVVAEMARVVVRGGLVVLEDQIAPADPLAAFDLDRFERRRDPSHHRTLSDGDFRDLIAANGLTLVRSEHSTDRRELAGYLALAGCTGEDAERVRDLSPGDRDHYVAESSWYVCRR